MESKVNFLVDTNIWLERLLDQDKAEDVNVFLNIVPASIIYVSDFTLHSIGVIMSRFKKFDDYILFIEDIIVNGGIMQLGLNALETKEVIYYIEKLNMDFDDAYQYVVSKKFNLQLVTFDKDFVRAGVKSYLPVDAIKLI